MRVAAAHEDPFTLLADPGDAPADPPAGFVGGGWFGLLGFPLSRRVEAAGAQPPAPDALVPFALARYDHLLRLDRDGQWWFEALWTGARAAVIDERLTELRSRLAGDPPSPRPAGTTGWRATPSPDGHARAVAACRERIAAGDLYQANLSLRLRAGLQGEPADLFTAAAATLQPDRAAFLAGDWGAVASLSPELFLERHGDRVHTAPIKGTRRSPDDSWRTRRRKLEGSAMTRRERDDRRPHAQRPGPCACPAGAGHRTVPCAPPGVWHPCRRPGRLLPGTDDADLLRATFRPARSPEPPSGRRWR